MEEICEVFLELRFRNVGRDQDVRSQPSFALARMEDFPSTIDSFYDQLSAEDLKSHLLLFRWFYRKGWAAV